MILIAGTTGAIPVTPYRLRRLEVVILLGLPNGL